MSFLRWPQLVRPTAICFLAKAGRTGACRSLTAWPASSREPGAPGSTATAPVLGLERDPAVASLVIVASMFLNILWSLSFLFFYLYLGRRAWRVDSGISPPRRPVAAIHSRSLAAQDRSAPSHGSLAVIACREPDCAAMAVLTAKVVGAARLIRAWRRPPRLEEARTVFATRMNESAWQTGHLTPIPAARVQQIGHR